MSKYGNCAFCGIELDELDVESRHPSAFHICCRDHQNASTYPQIWLLKKEMGIPYEEPKAEEKICAVCENPLTDKEFGEIKSNHINLTCSFHRRSAMDANINITREKRGYKSIIIKEIIKAWS